MWQSESWPSIERRDVWLRLNPANCLVWLDINLSKNKLDQLRIS